MTFIYSTPVRKAPGLGEGDALHDSILRLYNLSEGELRAVVERILRSAGTDLNLAAIAAAYESGVVAQVEAAVNFASIGASLASGMGPLMQRAMRRGGEHALNLLPGNLIGGFDVLDPFALGAIRDAAASAVREITAESELAIAQAIERAYASGLGPRSAVKEIRSVVGLTRRQGLAVTNFRRALISNIEADAGPATLIRQFGLSRNVVNARNLRLGNVDRLVKAYQSRWIEHRATVIARNEAVIAVSAGRRALWEQAMARGVLDKTTHVQVWVTTPDDRLCPICEPLEGQQAPIGGNFHSADVGALAQPPAHIACLPGDTRVTPRGRIMSATKRWIDGELIVLQCADGLPLSATPNHPILTRRGWVDAGSLNIGDEIAHPGNGERVTPGDGEYIDGPARIEDIAAAFFEHPSVVTVPVPTSAPDFHGDGVDSEVTIVGTDSLLLDGIKAAKTKLVIDEMLKLRRMGNALLTRLRFAVALLRRGFSPKASAVGSLHLTRTLCLAHSLPLHGLSFGLGTAMNASLTQDATDRLTGASEMFSNSILGDSARVHADDLIFRKIEALGHRSYSGYVYNLETTDGIYIAEGTVTHNCRCDVRIEEVTVGRPSSPDLATLLN